MKAPDFTVGRNLVQLDIRARFKCNVLAIKKGAEMNIAPSADNIIQEDDVLVIVGKTEDLSELELVYAEG